MTKNIVAVSQRVDVWSERAERRDALDQRLVQWLAAVGGVTLPVPNHPDGVVRWLAATSPVALILSGGNDIGEAPERDETERQLLQWALEKGCPVLGICRGMQFLGTAAGGKLVEIFGHAGTRHHLDGILATEVTSHHRWGFREPPPEYHVLAKAPDGSIEAIRHRSLPWEGWMWHPERQAPLNPSLTKRLSALLFDSR